MRVQSNTQNYMYVCMCVCQIYQHFRWITNPRFIEIKLLLRLTNIMLLNENNSEIKCKPRIYNWLKKSI